MKADTYEGGHRIPFIVRWPGKVEAGSSSNYKTTLTNLIATTAEIVGVNLNENTGEDSQSILPVLLNDEKNVEVEIPIIHHSSKGHFAIRKGDWKLIEKRGSGGFSIPVTIEPKEGESIGQLYNLVTDPSEKNNIYTENPKVVDALLLELNNIRER